MKIIKRSHIDLIIVSTQFQLMNSIELSINHLRSEHIGLIVLHQNVKHKTQIYELAQKYNLEILGYFYPNYKDRLDTDLEKKNF